jgi:hypothetical protein
MVANERLISLKREGICGRCGAAIAVGGRAWWAPGPRRVICVRCRPEVDAVAGALEILAGAPSAGCPDASSGRPGDGESPALDRGVAGGSAMREFERRHAQREERIRTEWGRLAKVALFFSEDEQSIRAWARGATGETKLAESLAKLKRDDIIVLHDRKVPGTLGNIDHLVIAPAGVHVVDAKLYKGDVRIKDVGGFFKRDERLYVGGHDRSKLADAMARQVEAVKRVLGDDGIPVLPVLCFIDAEWPLFGGPRHFRGVLIDGKKSIRSRVSAEGLLDQEELLAIATRLAAALPAAGTR